MRPERENSTKRGPRQRTDLAFCTSNGPELAIIQVLKNFVPGQEDELYWEIHVNVDEGQLKLWIVDQHGNDHEIVLGDRIDFTVKKKKEKL